MTDKIKIDWSGTNKAIAALTGLLILLIGILVAAIKGLI
jgi:hypothetical protein